MNTRRLKRLTLSPDVLIYTLADMRLRRVVGFPAGAKVARCGYDSLTDTFYIVVEHESFEEVPQGEIIPMLLLTVHTL